MPALVIRSEPRQECLGSKAVEFELPSVLKSPSRSELPLSSPISSAAALGTGGRDRPTGDLIGNLPIAGCKARVSRC